MEQTDDVLKPYYKTIRSLLKVRNEKDIFLEKKIWCVYGITTTIGMVV